MSFGRTNIATSLSKSLSMPITGRTQGLSFLFADGTEGIWYDIAPQYAYQDSAGTTAASVGDPVGKLLDRSGNGHHATQSTAASRPILRQDAGGCYYLEFDGVDDYLASSVSGSASATMMIAVEPTLNKTQVFAGLQVSAGRFYLGQPSVGAPHGAGWGDQSFSTINGGAAPAGKEVVSLIGDPSAVKMRVSGSTVYSAAPSGSPDTSVVLHIGANNNSGATGFAACRIYGIVVVHKTVSDVDAQRAEGCLAELSGVTL